MTRSVVKRRLKALAEHRDEVANGGPLVLPLIAYYGQEPEQMALRARFYADCALIFQFEGWRHARPAPKLGAAGGYGERGREMRVVDQGRVLEVNTTSAPLEWLASHGRLESSKDPDGHGLVRFAVARHFRDVVEGAAYSGLKGQAYDGGGGGGGAGRLPTDYMVDCLWTMTAIRDQMHPGLFRLMTMVVCDDVWIWEQCRSEKQRRLVILKLHKAIDRASVTLRYVTDDFFKKRWSQTKTRSGLQPRKTR